MGFVQGDDQHKGLRLYYIKLSALKLAYSYSTIKILKYK